MPSVIRSSAAAHPARRLSVIGVPSSAGARRGGQEGAPGALRAAGLIEALRRNGFDANDEGDLPAIAFRPDPDNPRQQNLDLVVRVSRNIAKALQRFIGADRFLLMLGGDCTVTIGILAGLVGDGSRLGVIYLDGDLDLNTPDTTPSGAFDGMVTAHLLGSGAQELAGIGPVYPLLRESNLVYFGYNVDAGGIDLPEMATLSRSAALQFPLEVVRQDPRAAARAALNLLEQRVDRILVHFDIDVTDNLAVDVAHTGGLSVDDTIEVLKIFAASPKCIGLVVTEFNPALDGDGSLARQHAALIATGLGQALQPV